MRSSQTPSRFNCKMIFLLVTFACLPGCIPGSNDTHESLSKELLEIYNEYAVTFETVIDENSAFAAAKKINHLAERAENVQQRILKLPPLPPEEQEKLDDAFISGMPIQNMIQTSSRLSELPVPIKEAIPELKRAVTKFIRAISGVDVQLPE